MKIPFLDLKAQYATIKDEVRKEMDDVLGEYGICAGEKSGRV